MKTIVVKFMQMGTEAEFTYDKNNESFDDFVEKLVESIPFEWSEYKGVELIYRGIIINEENFYQVPNKGILMAICTKMTNVEQAKARAEATAEVVFEEEVREPEMEIVHVHPSEFPWGESQYNPSAQPPPGELGGSSSSSSSSVPVSDVEDNSSINLPMGERKYDFNMAYAAGLTFLSLVKENPALNTMFNNDFQGLLVNLQQPYFKNIFEQILENSDRLIQGGSITLEISGSVEEGGSVENVEFTEEDKAHIKNMTDMGFDKSQVIVAYKKNNKDVNKTLEYLMK